MLLITKDQVQNLKQIHKKNIKLHKCQLFCILTNTRFCYYQSTCPYHISDKSRRINTVHDKSHRRVKPWPILHPVPDFSRRFPRKSFTSSLPSPLLTSPTWPTTLPRGPLLWWRTPSSSWTAVTRSMKPPSTAQIQNVSGHGSMK